jgi:hypothetical protein
VRVRFAKAGRIDHIWQIGLQLIYITKQQALNSAFGGQVDPVNYGQNSWLFHLTAYSAYKIKNAPDGASFAL